MRSGTWLGQFLRVSLSTLEGGSLATVWVAVIESVINLESEEGNSAVDNENLIDLPCTEARETVADVNIDSSFICMDLGMFLAKYQDRLT